MFLRFLVSLILAIISAKVFHYIFYLISRSWLISVLIGILVYYITYKLLKIIMTKKGSPSSITDPFKAVASEKAVKEGMEKLKNLRNNTRMIADNTVASKVQDICKPALKYLNISPRIPETFPRRDSSSITISMRLKKL